MAENTIIELPPDKSAIIFSADGTPEELHVSQPENDGDPINEGAYSVMLCVAMLNNPAVRRMAEAALDSMREYN